MMTQTFTLTKIYG